MKATAAQAYTDAAHLLSKERNQVHSRLRIFRPSFLLENIARLLFICAAYSLTVEKTFFRRRPLPNDDIRLYVGSGNKRIEGYLHIDAQNTDAVDLQMNILDLDFAANSVSEIYTSHMIEHLMPGELRTALQNWLKVLKPGGTLIIRCPNFFFAVSDFQSRPEPDCWNYIDRIFGPIETSISIHDLHKNGFSASRLRGMLSSAGFQVEKCEPTSNRGGDIPEHDLFCFAKKPNA